jgi:plastocyanin
MRRKAALAAAVTVVATLLAGCGDDEKDAMHHSGKETMDHHDHGDVNAAAKDAREVAVTATSFRFEPPEIQAKAGEPLAILLTSTDLLHDFTIDEFKAHIAADKGKTVRGGFTAGEPGRYRYYCSVEGHRAAGMEGMLVVQ